MADTSENTSYRDAYRAIMASAATTNGKPTTIKKISAPTRSEAASGSHDNAYLDTAAASKTNSNAPITISSIALTPKPI
jgi:hypothetical protein